MQYLVRQMEGNVKYYCEMFFKILNATYISHSMDIILSTRMEFFSNASIKAPQSV